MIGVGLNDQAEELLKQAVYAVEATDVEIGHLIDGPRYRNRSVERVERLLHGGGMVTVGSVIVGGRVTGKEMPVTVEVRYGRYKGRIILFYEACSRAVDHHQVRDWLDEQGFPGPNLRTDARNFIHCLHHIEEMAEPEPEPPKELTYEQKLQRDGRPPIVHPEGGDW